MDHNERVLSVQKHMRLLLERRKQQSSSACIATSYGSRPPNITRSKKYYQQAFGSLDLSDFRHIVSIDAEKGLAVVEPRVTMEELVAATLPLGLMPPVVPELKGITVGGAISGGAAESSGWTYGAFHDACREYEILLGNGDVVRVPPDAYIGYPGSYGSLGPLLSCAIQLISACSDVRLTYHRFANPMKALDWMRQRVHASEPSDFLDGIIFSKELAVIIEGQKLFARDDKIPRFSMKSFGSEWYYQHARQQHTPEQMDISEYLFRYDTGAFWMGSYVFYRPIIWSYLFDRPDAPGLPHPRLMNKDYASLSRLDGPGKFGRLFSRWFSSKYLWKLQHAAEKWVHDLMVIQDFCFREDLADGFLERVLEVGVFPLWLCPIKATRRQEVFCPHMQDKLCHVINVGIYGMAPRGCEARILTRSLERLAASLEGKKVLYSRSYYSPEEFWAIYSRPEYEALREKMHARGVWRDIADKVLSE